MNIEQNKSQEKVQEIEKKVSKFYINPDHNLGEEQYFSLNGDDLENHYSIEELGIQNSDYELMLKEFELSLEDQLNMIIKSLHFYNENLSSEASKNLQAMFIRSCCLFDKTKHENIDEQIVFHKEKGESDFRILFKYLLDEKTEVEKDLNYIFNILFFVSYIKKLCSELNARLRKIESKCKELEERSHKNLDKAEKASNAKGIERLNEKKNKINDDIEQASNAIEELNRALENNALSIKDIENLYLIFDYNCINAKDILFNISRRHAHKVRLVNKNSSEIGKYEKIDECDQAVKPVKKNTLAKVVVLLSAIFGSYSYLNNTSPSSMKEKEAMKSQVVFKKYQYPKTISIKVNNRKAEEKLDDLEWQESIHKNRLKKDIHNALIKKYNVKSEDLRSALDYQLERIVRMKPYFITRELDGNMLDIKIDWNKLHKNFNKPAMFWGMQIAIGEKEFEVGYGKQISMAINTETKPSEIKHRFILKFYIDGIRKKIILESFSDAVLENTKLSIYSKSRRKNEHSAVKKEAERIDQKNKYSIKDLNTEQKLELEKHVDTILDNSKISRSEKEREHIRNELKKEVWKIFFIEPHIKGKSIENNYFNVYIDWEKFFRGITKPDWYHSISIEVNGLPEIIPYGEQFTTNCASLGKGKNNIVIKSIMSFTVNDKPIKVDFEHSNILF